MMAMEEVAQKFSEYVALVACAAGVLTLVVLTLVGLYRVTLPAVRRLWGRSTRLGRFFGTLLFLVGSIYANTKPPVRKAPQSAAEQPQLRRIENWFRRGAWRDSRFLRFDPGWVFPLGTDHLPGVWIRSWGALADPLSRKPFAALGTELALFPDETEVFCGRTASNTYRIVWRNGFPDRRSRANPVSAAIELFRNGDFAVTTNGVTRFVPRELPFACAGRGQDADWVAANHPQHADAIDAAGGFAAWVDAAIGVGQTNGLYRFTADFRTTPPEAVELFVGPYTVAVTNAGAYVFLLEKGRDYAFGTRPFVEDVAYSAADDTAETPRPRQQAHGAWTGHDWTMDGGGLVWTAPTATAAGACCWLPSFRGAPDVALGEQGCAPQTFWVEWTDYPPGLSATYIWRSQSGNLAILEPQSPETEVCWTGGGTAFELSVTAQVGRHSLTSTLAGQAGRENDTVHFTLTAPRTLLLQTESEDRSGSGLLVLSFAAPYPTNGVIALACETGGRVAVKGIDGEGVRKWDVSAFSNFTARLVPQAVSAALDDVRFSATFTPEGREPVATSSALTVFAAKELSLGADAPQGIAILRGCPLSANVEIMPSAAESAAHIRWQTRRLGRNGTYGNWEDCRFERTPETATILTPAAGGIYQLQAVVSDGTGGQALRTYRWAADEDGRIGLCKKGDLKAVGVADEQWQLDLLNCARGFLGQEGYGLTDVCPAQYGFAETPDGSWKCNIFVAHRICQIGLKVPALHKRYGLFDLPPLANEWAGAQRIEGWAHAQGNPQPGWVIAHPNSFGSGHVGITDFDGKGVAAGGEVVNRRYPDWQDGTSTYRKRNNRK